MARLARARGVRSCDFQNSVHIVICTSAAFLPCPGSESVSTLSTTSCCRPSPPPPPWTWRQTDSGRVKSRQPTHRAGPVQDSTFFAAACRKRKFYWRKWLLAFNESSFNNMSFISRVTTAKFYSLNFMIIISPFSTLLDVILFQVSVFLSLFLMQILLLMLLLLPPLRCLGWKLQAAIW